MDDLSDIKSKFLQYVDNIILNNKLSHSYIIEVDDYEDSFSYVLTFIKMILCNLTHDRLNDSNDPIIHLIDTNQYPDLYVVSSDTSVINKSLIINLQNEFKNKSMYDNKRIYIIKEAEKLNSSSANTLLKFLEEPESNIIAILLTDDIYHVIDTIVSRCQILSLKNDSLCDKLDDNLIEYLDCIVNPESFYLKYNYYIKEVFLDKHVFINNIKKIELFLLDTLSSGKNTLDLMKNIDHNKIVSILTIIENELPKLDFNVNFKLWLDSFFSKLILGGNL